jgi:16S rRNA (adenine1518-N6/adenine1519-N6)-dimethyltransferase
MGQHFLVEPEVVGRIADAADLAPGSTVIEIGPGLGILTRELLAREARVIAIELDRELMAFLKQDLAHIDNLTLVERDARHVDVEALVRGSPYQLVANLPYSTGAVIIRRFLEMDQPPQSMTVMVQREVGERMTATAPSVSLLSIATQLYAEIELIFLVPADVFLPPPRVESAVVQLRPRMSPLACPIERVRLFHSATAAFQRKRKTISNGLSQGLDRPRADIDQWLQRAGIEPSRRPQTISLQEWILLAKMFEE